MDLDKKEKTGITVGYILLTVLTVIIAYIDPINLNIFFKLPTVLGKWWGINWNLVLNIVLSIVSFVLFWIIKITIFLYKKFHDKKSPRKSPKIFKKTIYD